MTVIHRTRRRRAAQNACAPDRALAMIRNRRNEE